MATGAGLAASAHAHPEQGQVIHAVFTCGASRAVARFQGPILELRLDGRLHHLTQSLSADGARYEGVDGPGSIVFWNKGREAALTIGSKVYPTCHQDK